MRHITQAVEEIQKDSTGRYRYVLVVGLVSFYSEPMNKEKFIGLWEDMTSHADLSRVQYEDTSEYTPGNYIWQTF